MKLNVFSKAVILTLAAVKVLCGLEDLMLLYSSEQTLWEAIISKKRHKSCLPEGFTPSMFNAML